MRCDGAVKLETLRDGFDASPLGRADAERDRDTVFDPETARQAGITGAPVGRPERSFVGRGQDNLCRAFGAGEGPLGVWRGLEETGEEGVARLSSGFAGGEVEVAAQQAVGDEVCCDLCHGLILGRPAQLCQPPRISPRQTCTKNWTSSGSYFRLHRGEATRGWPEPNRFYHPGYRRI
jgi:hypothetical protein